jgi:lipopolysaccharide heptosyltransferase II
VKQRRILVIKLCCVGDVIFMTPALRMLRQQYPDAHITYMASRWVKDIVERTPFIDTIIFWDTPFDKIFWLGKVRATLAMLRTLRNGKYDIAIVAHRNSIFSALTFFAGIRERIGFTGTRFLTKRVQFDDSVHETRRYIALIEGLDNGALTADLETSIIPKPSDIAFAAHCFLEQKIADDRKFVGIFPGGGENPGTRMMIKRWGPERYVKLIVALYKDLHLAPMMLGGKTDRNIIGEITGMLPPEIPVLNTVDIGGFGELCGFLKRCTVVVGGDSGPVHMAAALGVPSVMIFGPSDPRLVAPLGDNHRSVWKKVPCSPCYTPSTVLNKSNYEGNSFVCWTKTHECMTRLGVEEVLTAVQEVVKT